MVSGPGRSSQVGCGALQGVLLREAGRRLPSAQLRGNGVFDFETGCAWEIHCPAPFFLSQRFLRRPLWSKGSMPPNA